MQAVSVKRACVLLSAVACLVINSIGGGGAIISLYRCSQDAFVMVVDHLFREDIYEMYYILNCRFEIK